MGYERHIEPCWTANRTTQIVGLLTWLRSLLFRAPRAPSGVSPFLPGSGPARLIVLRHSEKTGERRDRNLSHAGHERAARLVSYVQETFGRPDFLIAAKSTPRSRRPVQTIEPLGSALGLEIKSKFNDADVEALVTALGEKQNYLGKFGVISWRHSNIPRLVAALGAPVDAFPDKWDKSDYSTIIDISYASGAQVTAKQLKMPF